MTHSTINEDSLNRIRLKSVRDFFNRLYQTYPDIFLEKNREFYNTFVTTLTENEENLSFENYIDTQRLIIKNLEFKNSKNWYEKFHSVYITSLRCSEFGIKKFDKALAFLKNCTQLNQFNSVIAPGCGRFFEGPQILSLLGAKKCVAQDIQHIDLELARAFNLQHPQIQFEHRDLTQATPEHLGGFELALFLHPQVCDVNRFENDKLFRKHKRGPLIPPNKLNSLFRKEYLQPEWDKILRTSINNIKTGGHAFFLFYEHREQAIFLDWLKEIGGLNVLNTFTNNDIVDPAFTSDYAEFLGTAHEKSMQALTMGAYRAGVVVQKKIKNRI